MINRANSDADDAEIEMVEDAARLYIASEYSNLDWNPAPEHGENKEKIVISIRNGSATQASKPSLYSKGYLEKRSEEELPKGEVIIIRTSISDEAGSYTYEYEVDITDRK